MLKVKGLESEIILKYLGGKKGKGPKRYSQIQLRLHIPEGGEHQFLIMIT